MGIKMEEDDLALYKGIDEILWVYWDPIGINYTDSARDEYQGYLPAIYSLKKSGAAVEAIAKELHAFETNNMGLSGNMEKCIEVAEKIKSI
jgi:hypothetical protein